MLLKTRSNKKVLSPLQKVVIVSEFRTVSGKLFQILGAATENALEANLVRVNGSYNLFCAEERSNLTGVSVSRRSKR